MEIESAARWETMTDQTIAGLVGNRVFRHTYREKIEGTGSTAIVVSRNGGWASPEQVNTVEYPLLRFQVYCDHSRDGMGLIIKEDGEDRAFAVARALDRRFHGVADQWWGARGTSLGLRVVRCSRSAEPFLHTSSDAHTKREADLMGPVVSVIAEYAAQVIH